VEALRGTYRFSELAEDTLPAMFVCLQELDGVLALPGMPAAFRQTADASGRLARSVRETTPSDTLPPDPLTSDRTRSVLTPRDQRGGRGATCAVLPAAAVSVLAHREKAKKAFHPDGRSERPPHETSEPPQLMRIPFGPHVFTCLLHSPTWFPPSGVERHRSPHVPGHGEPRTWTPTWTECGPTCGLKVD
jgi:hypothetical protein